MKTLERQIVLLRPCIPYVSWEFLKEVGDIHYWDRESVDFEREYVEKLKRLKPHAVAGRIPRLTAEMMDLDERLEWIFTFSQGYNQIDVEAATERGIMVSNCGGTPETGHGVSELAWAHILSVLRRIPQTDAEMRSGELMTDKRWGGRGSEEDLMFYRGAPMLWGKKLGIVGLGMAGSRTAITGRLGFNMEVIAYDPYITREKADLLSVKLVDLVTLCKESDVISIHAPLTKETFGMIGEKEIGLMKPNAIIVNDARGAIIDMPALAKALEEERIYGAGIDVWQVEPPDPDSWWVKSLQRSKRTSLTNHIGNVYETLKARHNDAMKNIERFSSGKEPLWVVNPSVIWKKRIS
jgi:phosphoglycerate dehydrogenase-like enzyme